MTLVYQKTSYIAINSTIIKIINSSGDNDDDPTVNWARFNGVHEKLEMKVPDRIVVAGMTNSRKDCISRFKKLSPSGSTNRMTRKYSQCKNKHISTSLVFIITVSAFFFNIRLPWAENNFFL